MIGLRKACLGGYESTLLGVRGKAFPETAGLREAGTEQKEEEAGQHAEA